LYNDPKFSHFRGGLDKKEGFTVEKKKGKKPRSLDFFWEKGRWLF